MKTQVHISNLKQALELRRMAQEANVAVAEIIQGIVDVYFTSKQIVAANAVRTLDSKSQTLINKVLAAVTEYKDMDRAKKASPLPTGLLATSTVRVGRPSALTEAQQGIALSMRARSGMTQHAIARALGVNRGVIARLLAKSRSN